MNAAQTSAQCLARVLRRRLRAAHRTRRAASSDTTGTRFINFGASRWSLHCDTHDERRHPPCSRGVARERSRRLQHYFEQHNPLVSPAEFNCSAFPAPASSGDELDQMECCPAGWTPLRLTSFLPAGQPKVSGGGLLGDTGGPGPALPHPPARSLSPPPARRPPAPQAARAAARTLPASPSALERRAAPGTATADWGLATVAPAAGLSMASAPIHPHPRPPPVPRPARWRSRPPGCPRRSPLLRPCRPVVLLL